MTTDTPTVSLGVLIALCIIIAFLIIVNAAVSIILWQRRKKDSYSSGAYPLRALSSASTRQLFEQTEFHPCIAVVGQGKTITSYMAARGYGEGRNHSTAYGQFEIKYNPPLADEAVKGVVILHDASQKDRIAWMMSGKPVLIEGTDAVRGKFIEGADGARYRWPLNCALSLTSPFDTILQILMSGHVL